MRARNIKQGFYKNEDLAECSVAARLIFPGLWMLADCMGRLEYRPKRIKGELLPFDNIDTAPLLEELDKWDLIKIYEVDGKKYIWIPNFLKHQRPHDNETASTIPRHFEDYYDEKVPRSKKTTSTCNQGESNEDPEQQALVTKEESTCNQGKKHFALNPESGILNQEYKNTVGSEAELNRECDSEIPEEPENTGEQEPEVETSVKRNDYPEDFSTFFRSWPQTNGSKKKAFQAWKKARDKPSLEKLLSLVDMLRKSDKWQRGIIPHPETWLNGKRWETAEDIQPAGLKPAAEDFTPKEFDPKTLYGDDFDARKFYASA